MKKAPAAKSKAQRYKERVVRRSYQVGGTKKRGVHVTASNLKNLNAAPKEETRPNRVSKPYKLHVATIRRLVDSIDRHCDAPMYVHLAAAGISAETWNQWRHLAQDDPDGLHAFYVERVEKALARACGRLHEAAVKHRASEVLFRRHHEFYPSEKQQLELSAPGGLPLIPVENTFNVVIELDPHDQPEPEGEFEIEGLDGKRSRWNPNGQQPP